MEKKETKITHITQRSEDIIKTVESMSVLELSNLVKALEEKFGVSAQAPVVATTTTQAVSETVKPEEEEKNTFDIVLKEIGPKKIQVIKEIRAITTLGLKEAKDLVEQAPKTVKQEVSKQEAEEIKKKLEGVGAKIELK